MAGHAGRRCSRRDCHDATGILPSIERRKDCGDTLDATESWAQTAVSDGAYLGVDGVCRDASQASTTGSVSRAG